MAKKLKIAGCNCSSSVAKTGKRGQRGLLNAVQKALANGIALTRLYTYQTEGFNRANANFFAKQKASS